MSEREMAVLIAMLEHKLGLSWAEIIEWLRDQNALDAIEARLIERGLSGGLVVQVEAAAARFAADLHSAYVESAQRAAAWLDEQLDDVLVRFDQAHVRAVAHAQRNSYELVRGLTDESRSVIRRVVTDGMTTGRNPRDMARDIRDSIGLTDTQAQHVENYRRALERGDWSDALRRELRDKRSDRRIRRLMRDKGTLTQAQVDAMVERYRKNYVAFRAETIARTEALRAAHEGTEELYTQALERGDLEADQLEERWNAGPNTKHARDMHQTMDGQTVAHGEDFVFSDGVRMRYPGDPRGGATHNASCRCNKSTRIKLPEPAAAAA